MNDDYQEGYVDGFKAGVNAATLSHQNPVSFSREDFAPKTKQKRKVIIRRQSPKQKLLKQMTDKKWKRKENIYSNPWRSFKIPSIQEKG